MTLTAQDRAILDTRIRGLVTAELMERARANPNPPYPADIVEVLDFVRRNPDPDLPRYAIVELSDGFAIAERPRTAGKPPRVVSRDRHPDRDAAEHAVLVHRLRDYGLSW
ncbi:hypothetical protein GCM10009808_01260 [Microbacterium sediminicola]|uniref:N,N-dimethylformamidase alpha subunit domain-containing protein n=1 Tax=Microbacterium sediminicola TaxID=415210 RepID=A0ABN2HHK7_9MICO